jgi:hypothetical protein
MSRPTFPGGGGSCALRARRLQPNLLLGMPGIACWYGAMKKRAGGWLDCVYRGGYPRPHRFGSVHKADLGKLSECRKGGE